MKDTSLTGRHAAPPPPPPPPAENRIWKALSQRRRESVIAGTILLFVVLLILAIALRGAVGERRYRVHLQEAENAYAAGDYEMALGHLRQAASLEENVEIRLRMVDCYEALENYDKALELLRSLDVKQESIQGRIAFMQDAKDRQISDGKLMIAGKLYDRETQSLVIRDTELTEDDRINISQLYALSSLTLSGVGADDLDFLRNLGGLTMLDLSRNQISRLDALSSLVGLRTLYLDGNPITDFSPLFSLNELSMLSIREIEVNEEQLSQMAEALSGCAIHSETAVAEVRELTLGGRTFREDVTELLLSGLQLKDISALSACKQLRRLDLSGNEISDLAPLMDLPQLEWLNLSDNQISDLRPLMAMKSLRTLDISNNQVSTLAALLSLEGLNELYLSGNPLNDFSGLSFLPNLEALNLENAGLQDNDLAALCSLKALKLLNIRDNPELTGETVSELKRSLSDCTVEHDPLVYTVEFHGQRYRRDLKTLDLSDIGEPFDLSDIYLMGALESLNLSGNRMKNIYSLQSMDKLTELDLSDNEISDVTALAGLSSLEKLDLSNNQLVSVVALLNLKNLKELDIRGNQLGDDQIRRLQNALPDCRILYE